MKRLLLLTVATLGLIGVTFKSACARYGGHGYLPEPVTQGLLQVGADGTVMLTKVVSKTIAEQHTRNITIDVTEMVDGKSVVKKEVRPETYTTTRTVSTAVKMSIPAEGLKLFDINGKGVALTSITSRLSQPTLVLLTADGKLHASLQGLFKKEALVLAQPALPIPVPVPELAPGPGPQPINAPPPPAASRQSPSKTLAVQLVRQAGNQGETGTEERPNPPFTPPPGAAPVIRYCQLQNKGATVAVRHFVEVKHSKTAYRDVVKNGVTTKAPFQVQQTIGEDVTTLWDRKPVKFLTTSGKPIADAKVSSMMTREIAVIASSDGQPVDPFWLQNINPEACVLVTPRVAEFQPPQAPVVPVPGPAPAPKAATKGPEA